MGERTKAYLKVAFTTAVVLVAYVLVGIEQPILILAFVWGFMHEVDKATKEARDG